MPLKRIVLLCAVLAGILSVLPYIAHTFNPEFHGLTIARDKDYANYNSRIERALKGHPEEAANAITPVGSGIRGLQVAGMEEVVGTLFSWTGLDGPTVAVIVTALLTPLLFILFYLLFLSIEFAPRWALGMTLTLFAIMFHGFTRTVHPGWSFVPAIGALYAFVLFLKKPSGSRLLWGILFLGALPYLYFWHWTFVWAVVGCMATLFLATKHRLKATGYRLALLALGVVLLSLPFLFQTFSLFGDPLYPEVAIRASFLSQRFPESWIRSGLLLFQLLALLTLFKKYRKDFSYIAALSVLLGLFIALHQNVIHNRVLMFASHFEPHMLIATTVAAAWVLSRKVQLPQRIVISVIAFVLLCGGIVDYSFAHGFFIPKPRDFEDQHLADAIAVLKTRTGDVVLTDQDTGRLVTSWTDDGIVYTTHARFLFITDADLAERYCVAEMWNSHPETTRVLSLEYNRILQSPEYQEYEAKLLTEACARVKKDPQQYLKKYGVTLILWNHRNRPEWKIDPTALGLSHIRSGMNWDLWEVRGKE